MTGGFFEFREKVTGGSDPPPPSQSAGGAKPISISELNARIDRTLKSGMPDTLLVTGEVSNFRGRADSGHMYFTLKDRDACIDCVMWKSDAVRVKFLPTVGMQVLATGR